jgi:hypothetical protein
MATMNGLKIGADPEVFVVDAQGSPVSAYGMIPGTKEHPHPVPMGAVQVDGMALEFNIDPASTEDEFVLSVQTVMGHMESMIPEGHSLMVKPVSHFGKPYIEAQPIEAKVLGCEPDFNAYTGRANIPPDMDAPFRTAAGHIHIGWRDGGEVDEEHIAVCEHLVKNLDFFLGIPSVVYDREKDRRILYGKAGAYRPKSYGVEYRVLSNFWLTSPERMRWVYRAVHRCWSQLSNGENRSYSFNRPYIDKDRLSYARGLVREDGLGIRSGR